MLFNSINYTLKNVFYNLEKILSGKDTSPLEKAEHDRLCAINQKGLEASTASGQFLDRARRGETLKPDQQTQEIVKDYVRAKNISHIEEPVSIDDTADLPVVSAETLARSITDEIPIFGLKASLHASTNSGSFDAWKNAHHLLNDEEKTWHAAATFETKGVSVGENATHSWRDLSRHTALRLIDHPNTPPAVLMQLAQHFDAEVRAQVADNPNTPQDAILKLINDECIDVRFALAECHHLGKEHLEILLEDGNPYVADRAESTLQRISSAQNPASVSVIGSMFGLLEGKPNTIALLRARA
jgi:hypothetical protein